MITFIVRNRGGDDHTIETAATGTLMEAIRDAGMVEEFALCGGNCSCATCRVVIGPAFMHKLGEMTPEEDDVLEGASERQTGSRLSCQIELTSALNGMELSVPQAD